MPTLKAIAFAMISGFITPPKKHTIRLVNLQA
jgi:hypothetical protein